MIVLPIGHDQSVYGRAWITWALLALNAAVFGYTALAERSAERDLERALEHALEVRLQNPDARIDPSVLDRAPERARVLFTDWIQEDDTAPIGDGDLLLEDAMRGALDALERMPSHRLGYRPGDPSALGFVTTMFVHADIWHLLGNMLFLWLAGAVIECFWEKRLFLALYFASGAAATLAHHLVHPGSMVSLVGASGAISGLLGAFVIGYPKTRVRMLYAIWPIGIGTFLVRAWLLIPLWAAIQLAWALLAPDDGTAYWAHIGGFAFGMLAALAMKRLGWVIEDAGDQPGPGEIS